MPYYLEHKESASETKEPTMQETPARTTVDLDNGYLMTFRPGNGAIYIRGAERTHVLLAVVAPGGHTYQRAQLITDNWLNDGADNGGMVWGGQTKRQIIERMKPDTETFARLPW